jgi:hypothetical protein
MKNKTFAIRMTGAALAISILAGICPAQSYWTKNYLVDHATAMTAAKDGNFIIAGGNGSMSLLKVNSFGDSIWSKPHAALGGACAASAVTATEDGNFIAAGSIEVIVVFLYKFTPNGDSLWDKNYGGSGRCDASAIISAGDSNFIIAGEVYSMTSWGRQVYLLKIKPDGSTVWTKTYGRTGGCYATCITPSGDGNFIVAGGTNASSIEGGKVILLKIKPNGDTLWTKTYGSGLDTCSASLITSIGNGNFIVAGCKSPFGKNETNVFLLSINSNGDTAWTRTFAKGVRSEPFAASSCKDGNVIIVTGYTSSSSFVNVITRFLKIKPDGDTLWTRNYGEPGWIATAIVPTPGRDFLVAGLSSGSFVHSLIDDRYARKDSLFTFKIPVRGDSLNHGYTPLKAPSGMTLSLGGTISWKPTTDSSYMDHVEFLVSDNKGKKDTLTFNIFVNSKEYPSKAINPFSKSTDPLRNDFVVHPLSSLEVRFSLPAGTSSLGIYNVHGQLLENISVKGPQATWRPKHAAGRYFAKAIWERHETVMPFMLMK